VLLLKIHALSVTTTGNWVPARRRDRCECPLCHRAASASSRSSYRRFAALRAFDRLTTRHSTRFPRAAANRSIVETLASISPASRRAIADCEVLIRAAIRVWEMPRRVRSPA